MHEFDRGCTKKKSARFARVENHGPPGQMSVGAPENYTVHTALYEHLISVKGVIILVYRQSGFILSAFFNGL